MKTEVNLVSSEKKEHVLFVKMTEKQDKVYQKFINSREVQEIFLNGHRCFGALAKMRQIVSHPYFIGNEEGKVTQIEIDRAIKRATHSGKIVALASLLGLFCNHSLKDIYP